MLDLGFVRGNLELVEEKLRARGADPAALLGDFRALDQSRREAITTAERLKARRNELSQQVGAIKRELLGLNLATVGAVVVGVKQAATQILEHILEGKQRDVGAGNPLEEVSSPNALNDLESKKGQLQSKVEELMEET